MKTGEYMRTLHEFRCPYCGTRNMIDNGDDTDLSVVDEASSDCKQCKKTFLTCPDDED